MANTGLKPKSNVTYTEPDPEAHAAYARDIYGSFKPPLFSTKPAEWEALARDKVPPGNFGYVFGAAGSGRTHAANTAAFSRYRLKPKMLVNATQRDLSVNLFGTTYPSPILAAPVGVQNIMHKDAEDATAKACRAVKVPMVLSTAATRTIEQAAAANGDGQRWYQLYWPKPQFDDITVSLLNRAKKNGYKVLVVTLDTFMLAWRPTDLDQSYLPFLWGDGCQIGFSDPVFTKLYEDQLANDDTPIKEKLGALKTLLANSGSVVTSAKLLASLRTIRRAAAWTDVMNSGTYRKWEHLDILRKNWDGPIVLKGIQTVEDAHRAIRFGMDGIIVSNHGGRQLDGAVASLDALAEIGADEEVKKSGLTVLFDSGIRTGSDVLTALALGAKAVLIGRPYMYGLALHGQKGVEHVFRCIMAETDNALGNLGKTSLSEVNRHDLRIVKDTKL